MTPKTFLIVILCCFFYVFNGCGKKDKKQKTIPKVETQTATSTVSSDTIIGETTVVDENSVIKSDEFKSSETKTTETLKVTQKNIAVQKNYKIYTNLQKLLNSIGLGETKTKQQLIDSKVVPEDALQIVKSVTKVSENELEIAWKSTWLVEKVSDVKLKDDKIKVSFKNGLVYTSGNAIGIKYEGEVYHDLIIKGDRAYIPSVKEYNWKIGKK